MTWTTPGDVERRIQREWDRGRILAARLSCEPLFPWRMKLVRPDTEALSERFQDVRDWIAALEQSSKPRRGFGYEIEWTEINHRQLGRNRVPSAIAVPTEEDALRVIGKVRQAGRLSEMSSGCVAEFPSLNPWMIRNPLRALERADEWEALLAVLRWFRDHPRCGLYLRQLDVPGVDTKFIEERKGLLVELLDCVLTADAIDRSAVGARGFEARYGLLAKPSQIRFRLLDPRLHIHGLSDLTTTAGEFAKLNLPVERVFVTENEINGLVFPEIPRSMVIFGLGYGIKLLCDAPWLHGPTIFYWGDIDTHGFAILDRLRATFPHARSFLMDRETLLAHQALWVGEGEQHQGPFPKLDSAEGSLVDDLLRGMLGDSVRLEQERIPFGWFQRALKTIGAL